MKRFPVLMFALSLAPALFAEGENKSPARIPDLLMTGTFISLLTIAYLAYFLIKSRNKKENKNRSVS
jgi:hypothetical protein